jgi:hypothetical protein
MFRVSEKKSKMSEQKMKKVPRACESPLSKYFTAE